MMKDLKKANVKSKVEAILFSAGQRIKLDEISRLSRTKKDEVIPALQELSRDLDEKQSSLMLVEEGEFWKLTVRDQYISIVRKIVTETELSKGVLETLAVIAFKYPILQSDLIKLRTNKSYDHLAELEAAGYVSRQKHGRTNLIKLTEKFFKYFDLTEEKLREQFKDFNSIAKAIKEKEEEVDKIKENQRKRAEELKQEDVKIKNEIDSLDEAGEEFNVPLKVYRTQQEAEKKEEIHEPAAEQDNLPVKVERNETAVVEFENKTWENKVEEETKTKEIQEPVNQAQIEDIQEIKQESEEKEEIIEEIQPQRIKKKREKKRTKGIHLSPEQETVSEKKAEAIIHGYEYMEEKKNANGNVNN